MNYVTGVLVVALSAVVLGNMLLFFAFRTQLLRLWREPVIRLPVVIFESDDWGAGPLEQAAVLARLRALLARYSDAHGRHPVMTLGLTLATPNAGARPARDPALPVGARRARDADDYQRTYLDDPEYTPILEQIIRGMDEGVFAAQLHGMEHYFPAVLMDAASRDPVVRDWLEQGDQYSELLPDHLQSRWINALELPSREHPPAQIESAVTQEVAAFARIFGRLPRVVVPPTFVWTPVVEQAWSVQGLEYLVTCGKRFVGRDASGKPVTDGANFRNGETSNGLRCLVRDVYFEPAKGHSFERVLQYLDEYRACGRPLLLETHRSNFTALNPAADAAFLELDRVLREVLACWPVVRFLSAEELGDALVRDDRTLVQGPDEPRLGVWLHRVRGLAPFQRFARLTGAKLATSLLLLWLRKQDRAH
jgi:hypothetical protein